MQCANLRHTSGDPTYFDFVFSGKILNPFTVLQFPNADCIGEDNLIGTCYTSRGKNKGKLQEKVNRKVASRSTSLLVARLN